MMAENKENYLDILSKEYDKVMEIPLSERAKSCNCFMCNDLESASCLEVYYFLKGYSVLDCEEAILNLKKSKCVCGFCKNCKNYQNFIKDNLWYYKMQYEYKYGLVIDELLKSLKL